MNGNFYPLKVITVAPETKDVKTIQFEVPDALKQTFQRHAGQHITLRFHQNGEELRRSYSISSSPFSGDPLQITVKRVPRGRISNHLNDHLKVNDIIEVMPPFGRFYLSPQSNGRRTHYFFGAGSGVTPLFSMLQSVLIAEPYSDVRFAYGNKNAKSIIFNEQLSQLVEQYGQRLVVAHLLSETSIWSGQEYWRKGRLDRTAIKEFINQHPPYAQDAQYYICGPGGMNSAVKTALMGLDVPNDRIHMEHYGGEVAVDKSVIGIAATAHVTLKGERHLIQIGEGETLLDAARRAGLTPPYSCQSGVCGACRAKLSKGKVHMRARMALEDTEITDGAILTCQSVATSPDLELQYP